MNRDGISALSDEVLVDHLHQLRRRERESTAAIVAHLIEVDARRLHLALGFGSFFVYLTEGLGYPEDAAAKRSRVTRLARRFPEILELLANGQLHLSGAVVLAPHLTEDNRETLLARASGKSKRAMEKLVADLAPRPDAAPSVRKLPEHPEVTASSTGPPLLDGMGPEPRDPDPPRGGSGAESRASASGGAPPPKRSTARPQPLGQARYKVTFTAPQALVDKLDRLKAVLSHRVPDGDLAEVLDRALDVAIETFEKQRFGSPRRSAKKKAAARAKTNTTETAEASDPALATDSRTRHISSGTRRQVYERDGGRCTYIGPDGRRCRSTHRLEFHHLTPFAHGGPNTAGNLTLRCKGHNLLDAAEVFGPGAIPDSAPYAPEDDRFVAHSMPLARREAM